MASNRAPGKTAAGAGIGRRQGEFLGGLHTPYYDAHSEFVTEIYFSGSSYPLRRRIQMLR